MEKTNVMRILDQKKINYKSYSYVDPDAISGMEVAEVLGQDPNQVFKTLVTVSNTNNYFVAKRFITINWLCSWRLFSNWNEKEFFNYF